MTTKAEKDADAIIAKYGVRHHSGTDCSIGTSPHRELIEELTKRGMSDERIAEVLITEKGVRHSPSSLQRHRRRLCLCQ